MGKRSVKLSTKLILGLASLAILYGLVRQIQTPTEAELKSNLQDSKVETITAFHQDKQESPAPAIVVEKCSSEKFQNLTSLNNSEFENWVKGNPHQHQWHWDNYNVENDAGEKIIFHVVTEQDQNGNEVLLLKTFKDEDEGPVFLEEKRFYSRKKLDAALEKKLASVELKIRQTIDSFQFKDGSEIKRTVENGEISEMRLVSEKGILDCQKSEGIPSCECK